MQHLCTRPDFIVTGIFLQTPFLVFDPFKKTSAPFEDNFWKAGLAILIKPFYLFCLLLIYFFVNVYKDLLFMTFCKHQKELWPEQPLLRHAPAGWRLRYLVLTY